MEIVLFELHSMLYWVSIYEIIFFVLAFLMYLKLVTMMGIIFLFTPHFFRGILGLFVNRKLPRSHQIIKDLDMPRKEEATFLKFEEVHKTMKTQTQAHFYNYYQELNCPLQAYLAITILCTSLDVLSLFANLASFGKRGSEDQGVIVFLLSLVFLGFNLYWFSWGYQLRQRFPDYIGKLLQSGISGFGAEVFIKM